MSDIALTILRVYATYPYNDFVSDISPTIYYLMISKFH